METYNIKKKTNAHCKAINVNHHQLTDIRGISSSVVMEQLTLKALFSSVLHAYYLGFMLSFLISKLPQCHRTKNSFLSFRNSYAYQHWKTSTLSYHIMTTFNNIYVWLGTLLDTSTKRKNIKSSGNGEIVTY